MTGPMPPLGPAGMIAGLREAGYTVEQRDGFVVFDYTVEVGTHAGRSVRIALEQVPDWPLSAPHGPHVSPRLGHPHGAVHPSGLGDEWEHWSRPPADWASDRTVRGYLRHLRTLFAQFESGPAE
ncbi:hypothetical protein ABZW18_32800 [Streptomyces sp. NPDC004647]|uniref:hypothetical protein n=1 Tax=Streptomyces sp. NPDC004647 TaxID=3154671 RepID=UPI0033BE1B2B